MAGEPPAQGRHSWEKRYLRKAGKSRALIGAGDPVSVTSMDSRFKSCLASSWQGDLRQVTSPFCASVSSLVEDLFPRLARTGEVVQGMWSHLLAQETIWSWARQLHALKFHRQTLLEVLLCAGTMWAQGILGEVDKAWPPPSQGRQVREADV